MECERMTLASSPTTNLSDIIGGKLSIASPVKWVKENKYLAMEEVGKWGKSKNIIMMMKKLELPKERVKR